jgi:hypothetical protein
MKSSSFIATLLVALVLGGGIAALLLLDGSAQTQVVTPQNTCAISDLDQDGDCVSGSLDFYPYNDLR